MAIAGIDYSSRAVDVVLLDEDTDAAEWHRFELEGHDAFERARDVRTFRSRLGLRVWDECLACGIEEPRGYGAGSLYRIQGAILACLPPALLVQPWIPSAWRKAVGLPGNASKQDVAFHVGKCRAAAIDSRVTPWDAWPQDACDAFCIALATRAAIQVTA